MLYILTEKHEFIMVFQFIVILNLFLNILLIFKINILNDSLKVIQHTYLWENCAYNYLINRVHDQLRLLYLEKDTSLICTKDTFARIRDTFADTPNYKANKTYFYQYYSRKHLSIKTSYIL